VASCQHCRMERELMHLKELEKLQIFDRVDMTAVEPILSKCSMIRKEPGEVLLAPGDENTTLFVLVDGVLSIHLKSLDEEPHTLIEPGECVGELSVVSGAPAGAYVMARESCRLLAIPNRRVWELLDASYLVARNLLLILSLRVSFTNNAVLSAEDRQRMFEKHARSDSLTGLHNRRHLDDGLEHLSSRLGQEGCGFSFLILDVDHFKHFNDTYGHLGGDCVLATLGRVLRETMRKEDILTRYGGEEFAVILPGLCIDEAAEIAERLRIAVSETEMTGSEGEPLPCVTISVGVTEASPGQDPTAVITAADKAMYEAKEAGRNRVCRSDSKS